MKQEERSREEGKYGGREGRFGVNRGKKGGRRGLRKNHAGTSFRRCSILGEVEVKDAAPVTVNQLKLKDILKPVKGQLDDYFDNSCREKPLFSTEPICYSPDKRPKNFKETFLPRARLDKTELKTYMRNYDVSKIKEHRILQSFTLGRKISTRENSDNRISSAIDLLMARESKKADSYLKAGLISKENLPQIMPKKKVFESSNFVSRTDRFYEEIAQELIQNDIKRENLA
ncbi:unnamed protein product [Moneuplotes crassus]|uniref:Uncharacterized protein n=1 Tax=Euplotes crassus TaxID=5936 RepID=A0AAD2D062_EUPCR|nr:unnamed protein product [Moneuplotes crassus]